MILILADRELFDIQSYGVSHLLDEVGDMFPGGVDISRSLILPGLDYGIRVPTDFLAEITGNVASTFLKNEVRNMKE